MLSTLSVTGDGERSEGSRYVCPDPVSACKSNVLSSFLRFIYKCGMIYEIARKSHEVDFQRSRRHISVPLGLRSTYQEPAVMTSRHQCQ